ncbi:MAG TPA: glutamine--fructose-6-phosphate transaminase (isomerizing) [Ktedonobacterales bacterium]
MCGIVGYVGARRATPILLDGLERLEYRGYDSAGIAVITSTGELQVTKAKGRLASLRSLVATAEPVGAVGIGHTRWATHGRPNDVNAHPHSDCEEAITVAHNGIIENYASLRDELIAAGHTFRSQTDTEALAHLIEEELRHTDDLNLAVRNTLKRVTGSYAIAVVSQTHPGRVIGARKDSPLIVGLGMDENFLASDIPAVLKHTREIIQLDDGEVADLTAESVTISDLDGHVRQPATVHVDWDIAAAERGGYPHFFAKEIAEQPDAAHRALLGRIITREPAPTLSLDALDALVASGRLDAVRRAVFIGCGTSIHSAMIARYALERWARIPVDVAIASEYRYADPIVGPDTLCVAISQSGETADVLAATRLAREAGAPIIAITNTVGSAITRLADGVLYQQAGPEISVAATKSFIATVMTIYLLGAWLGRRANTLTEEAEREILHALLDIPELMRRTLATFEAAEGQQALAAVTDRLKDCASCLYIGRGVGYPLALEGALKLKEISYVHAEGFAAGEMKHGPIALLDASVPLVAIATEGRTYEKVVSNVQEARARDAYIVALATEGDDAIRQHADTIIYVPRAPEFFAPLLTVIPMQLLAYQVALARGCNIDQPRNLAKSVTVE